MVTRNVLVTGGSSGIGRAIVLQFARAGDNVWFTYRSGADRALELIDGLDAATASRVLAFEFDQGVWESHSQLAAALPGPVDVLVNNAALGSRTVENAAGPEVHERDEALLRVNALGPLWLVRRFAPEMERRGHGKIINIASVGGGITSFPGFQIADGMSKAAMAYMTRHLAAEWSHTPVEVYAVCPGAVDTPMFQASTLDELTRDERDRLESSLPRGRLLEPAEIAQIVWWLSGEHSGALHGAVIDASMGLGANPALLVHPGPSTHHYEPVL